MATVLFCVGLLGLWLLFLAAGWPLPGVPGGAVVWYVHELLMGATLAAVAGFTLTAVPEFTDTPSFEARHVRWLLGLWLLGRLSFWLSGWWPQGLLALSGVFHVGLQFQDYCRKRRCGGDDGQAADEGQAGKTGFVDMRCFHVRCF